MRLCFGSNADLSIVVEKHVEQKQLSRMSVEECAIDTTSEHKTRTITQFLRLDQHNNVSTLIVYLA